jgi:hypothetical protein
MTSSSAWHVAKLLAIWTVCASALAAGPVPKVVRVEPILKWAGVEPNTRLDSAQAVFALFQPRYDPLEGSAIRCCRIPRQEKKGFIQGGHA